MKLLKKWMATMLAISVVLTAMPIMTAQAGTRGTAIRTAEDLLKMKGSSSSFYLANDIDMTEYGLWTPIEFSGTLDGNGYAISNLLIANQNGGLFSVIENAKIKNLKLVDIEKKGKVSARKKGNDYWYMDGLLAYAANKCTIEGISTEGLMQIYDIDNLPSYLRDYDTNHAIGGLIGYLNNGSEVKFCENHAMVSYKYIRPFAKRATAFIGGLLGVCDEGAKIYNCYNTGDIYTLPEDEDSEASGGVYTCGLVGDMNGHMMYCYNRGSITSKLEEIGTCGCASFGTQGVGTNCYSVEARSKYTYYWYTDNTVEPKCYKKTETEMKMRDTYAGWDFDDVWTFDPPKNDGYPILVTEVADVPVANYVSGTYDKEISVALQSSTKDATIYYTLDGSTPTESSYIYYNPLSISKTTTLKAMAVASGYKKSDVSIYKYTFKISSPKVSLKSGKYQGTIKVKLACNTNGAKIYYTLDGSTPSKNSKKYSGKITIKKTTTLKAIAIKGDAKSKVVTCRYVIKK